MASPLDLDFARIADLIHAHAQQAPGRLALADGERSLDYAALDALMDRVASTLQQTGLAAGDAIAICAAGSVTYAAVFLGALRAGVVVAPLAPGATPAELARMINDARARLLFADAPVAQSLMPLCDLPVVLIDGPATPTTPTTPATPATPATPESPETEPHAPAAARARRLDDWLAPAGSVPAAVAIGPAAPFNIIYSSGTTGEPKGIVQPHGMRWSHVRRGARYAYSGSTVTLLSTPLYSNTTLVVFFPTLAFGGSVLLMPRFDAAAWLRLAQARRVTHTMLVPVQYQRLLARPDFGSFDLSSFLFKFCTSAPFAAALKAEVLARWPGGLVEFYGMTEGGGTCILDAHLHPDKLHTVGRPSDGHDIRLIDDAGHEVPAGEAGEVVGHSPGMMTGYFGRPEKTREAEWFAPDGKRFIRTGDVGRFDADGFLTLMDRKKDMIISGGFNIYPSDLEAVLRGHPAVADAAVIGVPSTQWGETPVAFVVRQAADATAAEQLLDWANARVGKTQRLSALRFIDELPRSAIGKVLKRELRERFVAG